MNGGRANGRNRLTPLLVCVAVTLAAPLLVFAGAFGTEFDLWDWRVGHDLMALGVGPWLAGAGVLAALGAVWLSLSDVRRRGPIAAVCVIVAAATLWGYSRVIDWSGTAVAISPDVNSNPTDPPGFSQTLLDARARAGAVPIGRWVGTPQNCPLEAVPTQVAPGVAAYALREAGFVVDGLGVGRSDGTRTADWFGFQYDAVVRIRPGRTDVRVTARTDRPDGGKACDLARDILTALRPAS